MDFKLHAPFEPTGDQPRAIDTLKKGFEMGVKNQVLLGVTGSGKTFTIAKHWLLNFIRSSENFFPTTLFPILFLITTIINQKHTYLKQIPI